MGNNEAFSHFEGVIIACSNRGALSLPLLEDLIRVFYNSDMDQGGMSGDVDAKGRDVIAIVLEVSGVELPSAPELPVDWRKWTKAQHKANDVWQDERSAEFARILNLEDPE